jgi:hypothetical protein
LEQHGLTGKLSIQRQRGAKSEYRMESLIIQALVHILLLGPQPDTCVREWLPRAPSIGPGARMGHGMAFHEASAKLVLFGGTRLGSSDLEGVGVTWLFDGTAWTRASGSGPIPPRHAAMVYDRHREAIVLFTGDTWEWHDGGWVQRTPTVSPTPRQQPLMAYDATRQRVVLHGGFGGLMDTWEFDGTEWELRSTTGPATGKHMVFDESRSVSVLVEDDAVWEWDGSLWQLLAQYDSTSWKAVCYDRLRSKVLGFQNAGFSAAMGLPTHVYEWSGSEWVNLGLPGPSVGILTAVARNDISGDIVFWGGTGAAGRFLRFNGTRWLEQSATDQLPTYRANMVYDNARSRLVTFGGLIEAFRVGVTSVTVTVSGSRYTMTRSVAGQWEVLPTAGPSARSDHVMAAHPVSGDIVVFGGWYGGLRAIDGHSLYMNDTWVLRGDHWHQHDVPAPSARGFTAMAPDSSNRLMLFGGHLATGSSADTWLWDGDTWSEAPVEGPGARLLHAMAYDPQRGRTVLFGGRSSTVTGSLLGDTWEWDGEAWHSVATTGPEPRCGHAMAYDPIRQRVILVGGSPLGWLEFPSPMQFADEWEWDGTDWTAVERVLPSARASHALAVESTTGNVVCFGGTGNSYTLGYSDTLHLVQDQVQIRVEPEHLSVDVGASIVLDAVIDSGGDGSVRWYKDGQLLIDGDRVSGATTTRLTVSPTRVGDAGCYVAVVADECGGTPSHCATVSVTCRADVNADGVVSVPDIFAFLPLWFGGAYPDADINGDQSVTVADIFAFLAAWFAGCE